MPFDHRWQLASGVLDFIGVWTHTQVAQAMDSLPKEGIDGVRVDQVSTFDSSFVALIAQLLAQAQRPRVMGAPPAMRSLFELYHLHAWIDLHEADLHR